MHFPNDSHDRTCIKVFLVFWQVDMGSKAVSDMALTQDATAASDDLTDWPLLFETVVPLLMKQRLQVLPFSQRRDLHERNMYKVLLFFLDS